MVSEQQLETWAHQGAITISANTYARIKAIFENSELFKKKEIEIYLQGSYKNDTNIYGESDVDIVIQLNSTVQVDRSKLTQTQIEALNKNYKDSDYGELDFRRDVLKVLQDALPSTSISEGNKSINVNLGSGYNVADVIPCLQYRLHTDVDKFIEGMQIVTRDRTKIVNFPKVHCKNGEIKNSDSESYKKYKSFVRLFKNIKKHLVANQKITADIAPSYFIECAVFNCPKKAFESTSLKMNSLEIVSWLINNCDKQLYCPNGQHLLFGTEKTSWNTGNFGTFIKFALPLISS